jgi:ribosomal protein S18 acetylase RimI-like enzyme
VDRREVLARFDSQIRQRLTPPRPGWTVERVGRVKRCTTPDDAEWGNFVEWTDLGADDAVEEIAAQIEHFGALGRRFEWKYYAYDRPADLPGLLAAAGFVPEEEESVLVGEVDSVLAEIGTVMPPAGVTLRHAGPGDWDGIGRLQEAVWDRRLDEMVDELREESSSPGDALRVHVAVAHGEVVSAAWVRFHEGTDFASLWGGATRREWRGRGIYRALVSRRAAEARQRGLRYLQVDASADSRPILERFGMEVLTTTTPFVWSPPGG